MRNIMLALAAALAFAAAPALAQSARAIDGDTLEMNGERYRLAGIDAPEARQDCDDERGDRWPCGRAATAALEALLNGAAIDCEARGRDRGRVIAVCYRGDGADIARALVRVGAARDWPRYAPDYADAEAAARRPRTQAPPSAGRRSRTAVKTGA